MSLIAHQTEKEWISANEKSRQRMSQTQAEGAAEQHADRLEDAYLGAHHSCFTTQMNSLAASVKLTYSASMVDRLTDFCLKVRHEIGVSSIKVMNPPIDTRSSLFIAKSESE
ncbi:hypothetical protein TNCV_2801751 [Trichonephila clavipes]|nr:hypothetical protein TNCV_2801751 [Trichonephila clavipes]